MKIIRTAAALSLSTLCAAPALAQHVDDFVQRNARQQERIEHGLRNGALTVREAAALQQHAGQLERYQARAFSDGALSSEEARRIDRIQDGFRREISRQAHDANRADPYSRSSQRMADEVARNANQQRRIAAGVRSGEVTYREAARLERAQSYVNRRQAAAGADGYVGRHEGYDIRNAQVYQGRNIWRERHDGLQRWR